MAHPRESPDETSTGLRRTLLADSETVVLAFICMGLKIAGGSFCLLYDLHLFYLLFIYFYL